MSAPLVVYDTMVFLQAAVNPHHRYATMEAVEDKRLSLCVSAELIAEVRDVLGRPSLAAKFPALTAERVAQFLDNLSIAATMLNAVPQAYTWPQHPDDDHLFNLAIHAKARYLVTWEKRILNLGAGASPAGKLLHELAPELSIITPQQLAESLKTQAPPA